MALSTSRVLLRGVCAAEPISKAPTTTRRWVGVGVRGGVRGRVRGRVGVRVRVGG